MLHPQAEAALALWAADGSVGDPGLDADGIARRRADAVAAAADEVKEPVERAVDVDADGVRCRLYLPARREEVGPPGTLLYLHGGGFVFGDLDTHDGQSRRLANRTGWAVLAVDYRRPPEHRFPAAADDADTALDWLAANGAAHGVDPSRLAVVGDSAGANLALGAALRRPGLLVAAVLVYPFLDPGRTASSYRTESNAGLSDADADWYWRQYTGSASDRADPRLAPLRNERLGTLPPTLVQVAEHDVLRDEDLELAGRIRASGGEVLVTTYPGMVHGFWRQPQLFDAAEEALAEASDFLRRGEGGRDGGPAGT